MSFMLRTILIFLLFSCASHTTLKDLKTKNSGFSVLQGPTDSHSTVLRVVYPKVAGLNVKILDENGKDHKFSIVRNSSRSFSPFSIMHIKTSSLKLNSTYSLILKSKNGRFNDKRTFRSLTHKKKFKAAVVSCMSDTKRDLGNIMWPKALSHNSDFLFMIGDNLYADTFSGVYLGALYPVDERHLWKRHIDHSYSMEIYRRKKLIPTLAIWDDHDFGQNDGGASYKHRKASKSIFRDFFPLYDNDYIKKSNGVSFKLSYSGQDFYFLDTRYYRSENKSGTHLGKSQFQALEKELSIGSKPTWVIGGDQFFGGYHPYESYEGRHPKEFKKFINIMKKSKRKISLLSGDRHFVEYMKIEKKLLGYETFEYTVSGLHTKMYPGSLKRDPNPRRVGGFDGRANFAIFSFSMDQMNGTFEAFSRSGKEVSHKFSLKR